MTMRVEIDTSGLSRDLRLIGRELEQAQARAARDTLRRMQTIARREVRREVRIRGQSVSRRIRVYPGPGRFWVGADPRYAPLASSLLPPRVQLRAPRGRGRGGRARAVILDGRPIEGAFVPRSGRLRGRSVRRTDTGLERVTVDIRPELRAGFRRAVAQLPDIYDREFTATVNRARRGS